MNFNILKQFITHLYTHTGERNCLLSMFISITFHNIARLYEMMEGWLPPWIKANSTFVQYLFLCIFDMLLQTPYANCM